MAFSLYYQVHFGPLGSTPAPNGVYIAGVAVALLVGLNFSAIRIRLTDAGVRIAYGLFGKTLSWSKVKSCAIDSGSALRYGGWGIRLGSIHGNRVWVYNTIGGTRVAFLTESNRPTGMVVTTRNPDELMRIANQLIGMQRQ